MYDHVLIPIDFDHKEMTKTATKVAKRLLNDGGKMTLLHVIASIPTFVAQEIPSEILANRRDSALDELKKVAANLGDGCQCMIREGNPSREILDCAEQDDADCIVIASHQPGLQDYFLGSTAARVVRHAACPVHVLR